MEFDGTQEDVCRAEDGYDLQEAHPAQDGYAVAGQAGPIRGSTPVIDIFPALPAERCVG
jgi:hypothetical protein